MFVLTWYCSSAGSFILITWPLRLRGAETYRCTITTHAFLFCSLHFWWFCFSDRFSLNLLSVRGSSYLSEVKIYQQDELLWILWDVDIGQFWWFHRQPESPMRRFWEERELISIIKRRKLVSLGHIIVGENYSLLQTIMGGKKDGGRKAGVLAA